MSSTVNSSHWAAKAKAGFKTSAGKRSPKRGTSSGGGQAAHARAQANKYQSPVPF
uniref:Uncharacterized protein n=1 Tax=viral metagenome TaxID=1070528 RepID=A0A6M3J9F1_9ZZZZ